MSHRFRTGILILVYLLFDTHLARAGADQERQVRWEELSVVVGQKVRIVMPDSTLIQGKVSQLQTDSLEVNIEKSSNRRTFPKGRFLVPRATLRAVDVIQRPSAIGRVSGLAVGVGLGYLAARVAINSSKTNPALTVGFGGLAAGLPLTGYLLGRAADRRVVTYTIRP